MKKPHYRIGLTIQELEDRPSRAAEARRRNSFLVYPPRAKWIRRAVTMTERRRLRIAARNGANLCESKALYVELLNLLLDRIGYPK